MPANSLLLQGQAALQRADWQTARRAFEQALALESSPQAHDGLGLALWWHNQILASHHHRTLAYQQYKKQNDLARAALLAVWLGREQIFLSGNTNALKGWLARAERLLSELKPGVEHHWYALLRASVLAPAPELEHIAQTTLTAARTYRDDDLEAISLALLGIALVTQRRVASGFQNLDEAMTAALGGGISLPWVSEIFCLMLSACDMAGDLGRTDQWVRAARDYADQNHFPFLAAVCRVTFGSLLTALGRWTDAEQELATAIQMFQSGHTALRAPAVIKLADLYVWQGRLEEAEALLSGFEDMGSAILPMARLALLRNNPITARAILSQALSTESLTLDQAPLLRLRVDIALASQDFQGAQSAAETLAQLANDSASELLLAQSELAFGQIQRAQNNPDAAHYFESALKRLQAYDQSLLSARARFEMALLTQSTDRAASITWARAALASFSRMGAKYDADRASAFLRQMGAAPSTHTASIPNTLTPRERDVLDLIGKGLTNREIAERLVVSPKTVEHHVSQILSKLNVATRTQAAALALRATK